MPDAELVSLILWLGVIKQIKLTQARSIVALHFVRPKQGLSLTEQDGEADSDGASISVATVVLVAVLAASEAAAAEAVMAPTAECMVG